LLLLAHGYRAKENPLSVDFDSRIISRWGYCL